MLSFTLHTYCITNITLTGVTPYYLVYGMKMVMPLEVKIPLLRVLIDFELEEVE